MTVLLAIFDRRTERDLSVRSETLPIRVATPKEVAEEQDALELFRDDVGAYLALGGNRGLASAGEAFEAVRERRQAGEAEIRDPVVAAIVRAQGIDAGRRYVRYAEGEFRELEPEPERAASLLGQLDDRAHRAFDRETAAGTRETAEAYGERTGAGRRHNPPTGSLAGVPPSAGC